ncbi:hypothetical protein V9L05_14355 [Bernardetia sp. Wsw4-3y2]|uniref:hypothetical protein n=1 Tax=Bernardetia sp. Wsw4-3y2 TaxID=3127471 RepID=UPI0030CC7EB0
MKKQTINKSTLLLAVLAVAFWCFYFWQSKENEKIIYETQALVNETVRNTERLREKENQLFLNKTESSFWDSVHYVKRSFKDSANHGFDYKNSKNEEDYFREKIAHLILDEKQRYTTSISKFEDEVFFRKKWIKDYKYDKSFRKVLLEDIKENLEAIKKQSLAFKKVNLPIVNWNETDDLLIWLDLIKQSEQVINLKDSIITENKKQFPTSYTSDNFEGYSTLIPNYETQTMLIKAYWFPSDTKFYTSLFDKNIVYPFAEEQRSNFFKFNDSIYWEMKSPITYHVFDKIGDTVIFPSFTKERLSKMGKYESQGYKIPFKVISDK